MVSQGLVLPQRLECDKGKLTNTYGRFIAEPFERGYGHTIGNSLRRILLSSLEGAAITAVRIKGAMHEYSTLKGVQEDVLGIILNMKKLRIRLDDSVANGTLNLRADVAGPVLAKQLETNTGITVLNPELVIARLDAGGELEMELEVGRGKGYVLAENNKKDGQPVGTIPVDALFSPVLKVYYDVENARVGQITDYDRLILDIWTDGGIVPGEALSRAAKILKDSLAIFWMEDPDQTLPEVSPAPALEPVNTVQSQEMLDQSIDIIELSVRASNCLRVARIKTIRELVHKTEEELLAYKNFGRKSLDEIKAKLTEMGLALGMSI